jgi:hypothetical protein
VNTPTEFFHYPGGGFPLNQAAYTLADARKPEAPDRGRVHEHLELFHTNSAKPTPTTQDVDRAYAEAMVAYPLAVEGWTLAPYKITVTIPGATRAHVLVYQQAARFLRALGVLRRCQACDKWTIAHEPMREEGVIICDRCGWHALNWL